MFRRNWCGLPQEAYFPSDLKELGYYVHEKDEIRLISDPDYYYNFFLTKNTRVNARQRLAFDTAVQRVIHERLEALDLSKVRVPAAAGREDKHVNVFMSKKLEEKEHIIVVFGEHSKELGLIAGRICNGEGGVNMGSMVSVVEAVRRDNVAGGIVLANMGESYWWPQGGRAITTMASAALPMPSLVHMGIKYRPDMNDIPGSESPLHHARTVLHSVLGERVGKATKAKISLVAVGDSCETLVTLLNDEQTWARWGPSLHSALFYSPAFCIDVKQAGLKEFLAKRARGYTISELPVDTPLCGPDGDPGEMLQPLGFPCYSSGEPCVAELVLIRALDAGLAYIKQVSAGGPDYENPQITVFQREEETAPPAEATDRVVEIPGEMADGNANLTTYDESQIMKEVKILRRMKRFEATGRLPGSDSDSDSDDNADDDIDRCTLPVEPWPEASQPS